MPRRESPGRSRRTPAGVLALASSAAWLLHVGRRAACSGGRIEAAGVLGRVQRADGGPVDGRGPLGELVAQLTSGTPQGVP